MEDNLTPSRHTNESERITGTIYEMMVELSSSLDKLRDIELASDTLSTIKQPSREFVHLQLTQAIDTFRTQFNLLIQILTIFVVANVTILGFAIADQLSGILVAGALIPLMMIVVIRGASKFMMPVLYTAAVLERQYGGEDLDWIASTYLSVVVSSQFVETLQDISKYPKIDERINRLRKLKMPMVDRKSFRITLLLISLAQLVVALVLSFSFGWRFL